jgi:hypothetical protein
VINGLPSLSNVGSLAFSPRYLSSNASKLLAALVADVAALLALVDALLALVDADVAELDALVA